MQIKNNQILCVGEVLWDNLPSGPKPGGAPMNVAIHLNTIGQNVSVASRVGNDEQGEKLKSFLEKSGISTELIQVDPGLPTSEVIVHLDKNNNATYEICKPVAWDNLELTDSLRDKVRESGIIIYGSLASRSKVSRATILSILDHDAVKVMDVNLRKPYDSKEVIEQLLKKTDIVKLNDEELIIFANWYNKTETDEKSYIKWFAMKYNMKAVCITKGSKGAILFYDNQFYEHRGFRVNTVDSVGAGDAFLAGLVASLSDHRSPDEALSFACATGAFVAGRIGATPEYDINEIDKILKSLKQE
jgi:fructokinase